MLPDEGRKNGEHYRTLILCEGEINAMSLYQVAHETGVDVLSVGSEAASIPQGIISIAGRYGAVFTWFDRAGRAAEAARVLAGAHAISVPNGQDANDLLQAGRLGGFLVANRLRACGNDVEQLNRIKWGLWDAAQMPMGIDDLSAEMLAGMV